MTNKPGSLAIIGISCMFPKADNLQAYWANIKGGVDAITDVPEKSHWKASDYFDQDPKKPDMTYAAKGGFINPMAFDPLDSGIAPKDIEATDTTQLLGMMAAKQALVDAGYGEKPFDRQRTSVILGVTGTLELVIPLGARLGHPIWRKALKEAGVDAETSADVVQRISDSYVPWQENSFPGLLGNVAAGRIANRLDLGGTNCVVDAACASSFSALHMAAMELESGRADMVITGGLDTFNDIFMYMCFSKTPALSPTGSAKPFDANGDGTILGEGIGLVVLKRLADAQRDGDKIYATIKGIGSSSDGKGNAIYAPRASGQVQALKRAYAQAGVTPDSIELIEGHGTGTKVGDATEVSALTEVYQPARKDGTWCALGSVKSQIGHTKAAAGVAGLIKAALSLHHKVLPPTIKVTQPVDEAAPGKSPFYINTQKRPWLPRAEHPRRAGVSAFGFGGTNFHCVLEENEALKPEIDWDGDVQILAFCSDQVESIQKSLADLPLNETWENFRIRAAGSRKEFRLDQRCRLLLVVEKDKTDLAKLATSARSMLEKYPDKISWTLPQGAAFGCGTPRGKLGVLFPGQGSQYTGMMRDLACQFPQMQQILGEADRVFAQDRAADDLQRLSDYIYPHPSFSEPEANQNSSALKATNIAQPAIGAVSLGALSVLEHFGLVAEAAAGHSYGELLALCASGRIQPETLHSLSNLRGRLMAGTSGTGERGAMLAVQAPFETVNRFIVEEKMDLVVANRNGPNQSVLAGSAHAIDAAAKLLEGKSIRNRRLSVSAAFHSPLVADAQKPFEEALSRVDIGQARIPVFSNTTAQEYPDNSDQVRQLLAGHLAKPVDFVAEIEKMHESGVTTFMEVGPGHTLTDLVQSILPDRDVASISLDASRGTRSGLYDLANAVSRIAALGYTIHLSRWDEGFPPHNQSTKKPALTIPVCGANSRLPRPSRPPTPPKSVAIQTAPVVVPSAPVSRISAHSPAPLPPKVQPMPTMAPVPISANAAPGSLQEALRATRESLMALQRMQEQTAQLHRQFLEGQEAARRSFQMLMEQQQRLLSGGALPAPSAHVAPVTQPAVRVVSSAPIPAPAPRPAEVAKAPAPVAQPKVSAQSASQGTNQVAAAVLEVVAEKTGYPSEMLNLSMGLDSDLGIDSIKRVEIMSAVRAKLPDAPEIKPEHLGTLQTLQQVVDFLCVGGSTSATAAPAPASHGLASTAVSGAVLEVVAEKTGYPAEMLNLSMGLDSDLGIDSIKRVEIMSAVRAKLPNAPEIKPEHLGTLQTLQQVVDFLCAGADESITPAGTNDASIAQGLASNDVASAVLEVVAEKTGYPAEMLNLSMGLDSDLGIDSIKRVEIMSAVRAKLPGAPEIKPEHLGTLQTLQQVVDFLCAESGPPKGGTPNAERANSQFGVPALAGPATCSLSSSQVASAVLEVVAEKTGYPAEMLNLSMGLDSDLGIDSIKRVEIMSAVRAKLPGAPEIKPEHLGTLQTLQQVVDFLCDGNAPAAQTAPAAKIEAPVTAPVKNETQQLDRQVLTVVPLPHRETKINLPAGSEIWIADDTTGLATDVETFVNALGYHARRLPAAQLLVLARPQTLGGLIILSPAKNATDATLAEAFRLLQHAASGLRHAGKNGGAVLATVSRLDGQFGLGELNCHGNPLTGGLAGMTKTARHEWPEVHCRALDLNAEAKAGADAARFVVEEAFHAGPIEAGFCGKHRIALDLRSAAVESLSGPPALDRGDVVIISGGARGVTAETAVALARHFQPTLVLLGRSPAPVAEPAWLSTLTDEGQIKKAIIGQLNGHATPKAIEAQFRERMANREIRQQIARMEAAGAKVVYHSLDIRNADEVSAVMKTVREAHGPICGLIHGAGVLADKRIEDKTAEQFQQVYSTKVTGLQALLGALAQDDLKVMGLFSSFTGRYGRIGQVDYAIANEVLNKLAQAESRHRPTCRVVSVNWGPWDGGMVNAALSKVFAQEGVGLINPLAGAEYLVHELSARTQRPVEVTVMAPSTGFVPAEALTSHVESGTTVAFERDLTLAEMPCLQSHVLGGRAVLPVAIITEWLAHGAMHAHPGMTFCGVDHLKIFKGVLLDSGRALGIRVNTRPARNTGNQVIVAVELVSNVSEKRPTLHASAEIILASKLPTAPAAAAPLELPPDGRTQSIVYSSGELFHGPHFYAIEQLIGCGDAGIAARVNAAPAPKQWIQRPLRQSWFTDPLVLDASYQLMILWSQKQLGTPSLPCAFGSYRQYRAAFPKDGTRVVIRITESSAHRATADMEFLDAAGQLIASLTGYECVIDASLKDAFRRNQIVA